MSMTNHRATPLKAFVATLVVFLAIDSVWLGIIAPEFYRSHIGHLLKDEPDFVAAAAFYVVYISGIVILAVLPGLSSGRWQTAAGRGAVLGFVAYGTYDLTNLATLEGWPVIMVVVDLAWGTVLTAVAAASAYWLCRK